MDLTTYPRSERYLRRAGMLVMLLAALVMAPFLTAGAHAAGEWDAVVTEMEAKINQIPGQYAAGDQEGVETSIRQAYYEIYQVSGLEAEIDHRLGAERNDELVSQLLSLRDLTREGSSQDVVEEKVAGTIGVLRTDVAELADAPEVTDKWSRVATRATDQLDIAKSAYANGDYATAANAARDAYLAHYEADGLEKATISYLGQGRVSELETMFTQLRQTGRDGSLPVEEFTARADTLAEALRTDAAELDSMTSQTELGWSGFWASFAILLREGAEALLVVAALVTYAVKAGRRDQVVGLIIGVIAAVASAIGLAFLFSRLTASAATGLGQELLEGITGLFAVVMLIWVSNWILSKASGKKWEAYIHDRAGKEVAKGGVFALASVAFLAVLREGAETILFFAPILAASKTSGDYVKIWLGVGAAVLILAIMFVLIWVFGVRLPMKAFFKWTSVLLGILAVTIAGGAIKEFQDATLISATHIDGVPTITLLGLYPTVETLVAQGVVVVILAVLAIIQYRAATAAKQLTTTNTH
ncbi:MAG: FTR1 family iron permease [Ancrocorticia sp.]